MVGFGEPGLDYRFQALTCEDREETKLFPPPYGRVKPVPRINGRHGVRGHVVSGSWSPVSRGS
jgi:hypothetical protein